VDEVLEGVDKMLEGVDEVLEGVGEVLAGVDEFLEGFRPRGDATRCEDTGVRGLVDKACDVHPAI